MPDPEPEIADTKPAVVKLEAGVHFWCACGKSSHQPLCDGSHKGTGIGPVRLELTEEKTLALCNCKHSGDKPYCDGTHASL